MLTFNHLLSAAGLDPSSVRLARHRREVFAAAMNQDPRFDEYQEHQESDLVIAQLRAARYLAAFAIEPLSDETVFVGIWERLGERAPPVPGQALALAGAVTGTVAFETRRVDVLSDYRGRIVVAWGDGTRTWVQRADRQDKPIVELRKERLDPVFPGYVYFRWPLGEVARLPAPWGVALRAVRGVYLLVHRDSGQQYVGAALGTEGFLGRWLCYLDGHGGNVGMRELAADAGAYDVAILEFAGSEVTETEILQRETVWKTKLGSRVRGLNRN